MTGLRIERVWKEYGDQIVLENLTLEIAPRSFLALVGPSGCGKTTFLRMLLGQERPTRGRILLDGEPLPPEPGPDRGVVCQRYSVFPHLTVLGNVLLGPELQANRLTGRSFGAARRALRPLTGCATAPRNNCATVLRSPETLPSGRRAWRVR